MVGLIKDWLAQAEEAEAAAALPVDCLGDAALLAIHHLFQARDAVGDGVLAQLNADVAPAHLVHHGNGGATIKQALRSAFSLSNC